MPDPVIHHVQLCVHDSQDTLERLKKFGFKLYATRQNSICKQLCLKLNGVYLLISERREKRTTAIQRASEEDHGGLPVIFCCESKPQHEIDSVFNVAFLVNDVDFITDRVARKGGVVIQKPTNLSDADGEIRCSIVKSICGNVVHTLLNTDQYNGAFLVGFQKVEDFEETNPLEISHIDHFTLACYPGHSKSVINFYERCFGMKPFSISNEDTEDDGLILEDGVGLRLRAMEFFRCAETGLTFHSRDQARKKNSVMLVIVETLSGQTNCNVETFLRNHRGPGLEHVAFSTEEMCKTVSQLNLNGVRFRMPPFAYYEEIQKRNNISDLGEDLNCLKKLGILLDNETTSDSSEKKYIMQIFAHPLFNQQTFFIEIISRVNEARGLGSGNVIALVRSIRQEERRKLAETKKEELDEDGISSPRRLY